MNMMRFSSKGGLSIERLFIVTWISGNWLGLTVGLISVALSFMLLFSEVPFAEAQSSTVVQVESNAVEDPFELVQDSCLFQEKDSASNESDLAEALISADALQEGDDETEALVSGSTDSLNGSSADALDGGMMLVPEEDEDVVLPSGLREGTYLLKPAFSATSVLDVAGGSKNKEANIQLWKSNMSQAQRFELSYDENGYCTLTSSISGMSLDVSGGSHKNGTNVQQYPSNDTKAQKWIVVGNENGTYTLKSALGGDAVLDVVGGFDGDGANVQIWESNSTLAQAFEFIPVYPLVEARSQVQPGVYRISSALSDKKVVDIAGASLKTGSSVQLYDDNSTLAQMFSLEYDEEGFCTIRSILSGKVLDVDCGNLVPGAVVQQWDSVSNDNQKWSLSAHEDDTYTFSCKRNGLVLDVMGASTANGTRLQTWSANGSDAQKWVLTKVESLLSDGVYSIRSNMGQQRVVDIAAGSIASDANVQMWSWNNTPAQRYLFSEDANEKGVFTIESLCSGLLLTQAGSNVVQEVAQVGISTFQQWRAQVAGAGGIALVNVATGLALDVSGAGDWNGCNVGVYPLNGTVAQSFAPSPVAVVGDGTYTVRLMSDMRVLDVSGGSRANGANVQVWTSNGTGAQKWNIRSVGDGWFVVENARSRKALDVMNYGTSAGTNVQQWQSTGNNAQKWSITYIGEGVYRFTSACSGLVLDVAGAGGCDGTNVQIYSSNSSSAQRFRLEATVYVPDNYEDVLGSFTTISTNTYAGTFNMQRACNSFNNYVIQPGDTMSFFDVAGPCGAVEGYLAAGVVGGEGYGGGICQASTTLYGASIRAGLTIVERRNHSIPSTYVPIGLDAMVNYGTSDFKVRNDWNFPVMIRTNTSGTSLNCAIYGIQQDWYDSIEPQSWSTGEDSAAAQRIWYKDGEAVRIDSLPMSWY